MKSILSRPFSLGLALFTGVYGAAAQNALAQDHIVSPAQIQQDINSTAAARQKNETAVRSFLATPQAERAMQMAGVQPQQVNNAVSQLSNSDLAQLAARSQQAQKDFAAGKLTDHDLLIIAVAILALILIIVAVH
jgi:hypothetical protein